MPIDRVQIAKSVAIMGMASRLGETKQDGQLFRPSFVTMASQTGPPMTGRRRKRRAAGQVEPKSSSSRSGMAVTRGGARASDVLRCRVRQVDMITTRRQ